VNLTGIRILPKTEVIDRPLLVLLRSDSRGHFVLVRPVGASRRMVQVVDSNREPFITDSARLFAAGDWTGLALAPDRTSPQRFAIGLVLFVASFFFLACSVSPVRSRLSGMYARIRMVLHSRRL
jgi:hypothetical protein